MAGVERTTGWQQIQQGVKEAENLIVRKEYNLVMIKARQTLEFMVRCLAEKACLVEGDLSDTIDQLYEGGWIDKRTKDNYHTIRILGNKAVHEGADTAYDANQAYQILAQEVHVFAQEVNARGQGSRTAARSSSASRAGSGRTAASSSRSGSGSSKSGQGRASAQRTSVSGRSGAANRRRRKKTPPAAYVLRILIPVLAVILLVIVIRMILPGREEAPETQATDITTSAEVPTTEAEPETPAETQPPAETYRVKGSSVNVRMEPSTDSRILVQLSDGTEVTYVKRYNNDWTVINYDGQEAYVSSQFIERVEPETQAPEETAAEETAPAQ